MVHLWRYGLAVLCVVLVGYSGLSARLGAHPWWADSVVWIGGLLGVVLGGLAERTRVARGSWMTAASLLGLAGFAVAAFGKARFAASYAEDRLAGHLWHYGWILGAVGGGMLLLLALGAVRRASVPADRR